MSRAPEDLHDMYRAGYKRLSEALCKGCNAPILWMLTTHKKKLPLNLPIADERATTTCHWDTCPNRDEFKGAARLADEKKLSREDDLERYAQANGATVIVALYPEGTISVWKNGQLGDDVRQRLHDEAHRIRFRLNIDPPTGVSR